MPVPSTKAAHLATCFALLLSHAWGERPDFEEQLESLEVNGAVQPNKSESRQRITSTLQKSESGINLSRSKLMMEKGSAHADGSAVQQGKSRTAMLEQGASSQMSKRVSSLQLKSHNRTVHTFGSREGATATVQQKHMESSVLHKIEGASLPEPQNDSIAGRPAAQSLLPTSREAAVTGTAKAIGSAAQKEVAMVAAAITFLETESEVLVSKSHSLLESTGVAAGARNLAAEASASFQRVSRFVGKTTRPRKKRGGVHASLDNDVDEVVDEVIGSAIQAIRIYARSSRGTCPKNLWHVMPDSTSISMNQAYVYGLGCKVACSCPWGFVFACYDNDYDGLSHAANAAVTRLFVHRLGHCKLSLMFLYGLSAVGLLIICMMCSCAWQTIRRKLWDAEVMEVKLSKGEGVNFRG